jgi:hypothetical protein
VLDIGLREHTSHREKKKNRKEKLNRNQRETEIQGFILVIAAPLLQRPNCSSLPQKPV